MDMCVTAQEFQGLLATPQLRETLRAIDIDESGAMELFHLIDIDLEGKVSVRDIMDTCIKSHGPAKAIDLIVLMSEHRRQANRWQAQMQHLANSLQMGSLFNRRSAVADKLLETPPVVNMELSKS